MDFHGVHIGMPIAEAIARLQAHARELGEHTAVQSYTDEWGGGSYYLKGQTWTFAFNEYLDQVCTHLAMYRSTPAGRDASLAWLRECIAASGPPHCLAMLGPRREREVDAALEWNDEGSHISVTLLVHAGTWDVREDLHAYPLPRTGLVEIREHREHLAALAARIASQPAHTNANAGLIARMHAWVRAHITVLAELTPLLPDVGLADVGDEIAAANRMLDMIDAGPNTDDGAFLIAREPLPPRFNEAIATLHHRNNAAGPQSVQLTTQPRHAHEPTTREPLPPPPDEYIEWVDGPLAARLIRDALRAADLEHTCEVVPASFVTVADTVEHWPRVPPAADAPASYKYSVTARQLRPLRLTHPASGLCVHLNRGESEAELRRYAHALLAARLAARP